MQQNLRDYKALLKAFRDSVGFVNNQISSFDEFIEFRIQKIFEEIGEIVLEAPDVSEFKIKLGKVRVPKPCIKEADGATRNISPMEARMRDLTYASPIHVEMIPVINGVDQEPQEIAIGELPIMVKSKSCHLAGMGREELIAAGEDPDDPGGYFIINGTERVIVMVEEVLSNRPIIEIKGSNETARINSESSGFIQRHLLERKGGILTVSFANIKKLPLVVLMRALGIETDKDIIESISTKPEEVQEVYFNIYEHEVKTVDEAKKYIGKKLRVTQGEYSEGRVNDILDKYLLPHLGQDRKYRIDKAMYLAKVIRKIVRLGLRQIEAQDIDHYGNRYCSAPYCWGNTGSCRG